MLRFKRCLKHDIMDFEKGIETIKKQKYQGNRNNKYRDMTT